MAKIKCPHCGELKPSDEVHRRPNYYAREIGNSPRATMTCCDDCAEQNALDI